MPTISIDKAWTALPADYCFTTFDKLGNDFMDNMALTMTAAFTFINRGATAPVGANQAYLWFNPADQRMYEYIGGVWVSRYPVPVGSAERRIWTATLPELWAYDGGDGGDPSIAGNVTDTTGSFWTVDTTFAARFPLGVGNLPSGTAVNLASTGGTDAVAPVLPAHTHDVKATGITTAAGSTPVLTTLEYAPGDAYEVGSRGVEGADAQNIMNPYLGVYFIKRTARVYYTASGISGATSIGSGVYFGAGAPAFVPSEGYGVYFDYTTRDMYIWNTTTSSWTL